MDGEDKLFSDDFVKEQGIETAPAEEQAKEGQEQATEGQEAQTQETDKKEETTADGEEPTERKQETTADESKETESTEGDKKPEEGAQEETPEFDVTTFNKFFEKDFKDTDDIKGLFEKVDKVKDYDEKIGKLDEYESTLKEREALIAELKESNDPMSYFSSPESYKAEMIKKQFPDKDPVIIEKVIKSDLSKVKDFDILVDKLLMDNAALGQDRSRAANILMDDFGIDAEDSAEEWSTVIKDKILVKANAARKEFKQLGDEVQLPEVLSPEERLAQKEKSKAELTESWKEPIARIAQYEKEAVTDDEGNTLFEYNVPDEFKQQIGEYVNAMVQSGEIPVNEDNLKFIESDIRKNMLAQNLPKILKVYKSKLESEWQEQKDKEEGNTEPPNKQTAPPNQSEGDRLPGIEDMLNKTDTRDTIG